MFTRRPMLERTTLLISALLLVACGSRSALDVSADGAAPPPPPPPPRDAGRDTAVPPPPPMGCALGPIRGPYTEGAPGFAFSLERYDDPSADSEGEYLVGYAVGWPPDERGSLSLLDLSLEGFHFTRPVGAEQVSGVQHERWVMQFTHDDNVLDVAWLAIDTGGAWEARVRTNVCHECFVNWAAMTPVLDAERGALAYRTRDQVVLWAVPTGGGASPLTRAFADEAGPHLAAHRDGYVLATNPPDRGSTTVRFLTRDFGDRAEIEVPIFATGEAPGLLVRDDDVIAVGRAGPDGGMHWVRLDEDGIADVAPLEVDGSELYLGISIARAHGLIAMTLERLDRVEVLVLSDDTLEPVMEVTEVSGARGSYRRSAHIVDHPEGFAIVYGGWEAELTYGVFGRLLTCVGFD